MKLFRVTCEANGMSLITPEPSDMTAGDLLEKLKRRERLCPELHADIIEHGSSSIDIEILSDQKSGVKIAKLERLNIKMLGDKSYTSEAVLTKMYNL